MCNLYTMTATVDELRRVFGPFTGDTANLPAFGEIYPGREAPVLRSDGGGLSLDVMTWGFPGPSTAGSRPVTNVRNLASPFWRSALGNPERRCIVPVTRFCEWTADPDPATGRKRKVWFGLHEDHAPLFAFAGIWRPVGEGRAMAFLTCEANALVGAVHPKAMPVILRPDDVGRWLGDEMASACSLAVPYPADKMRELA
jgi:putative SOS response-associated peptidase YedK